MDDKGVLSCMKTFFSLLLILLGLPFCKAQQSAGTNWKKIDFTIDRQVMDIKENRERYKFEGSEECLYACRFVPQLEINGLWVSSDRKKFKAQLTYKIIENYDTADTRNYLPAEGFDEFIKDTNHRWYCENYAWKRKKINGETYVFRYLIKVADDYIQKGYAYHKLKLDKPVNITYGQETKAEIFPGKMFEWEGRLDVPAQQMVIDSFLMFKFKNDYLSKPEAITFFPVTNTYAPHPQNNTFTYNEYYYNTQLKNYAEQQITDEILYNGQEDLKIIKISSTLKAIRCEIKERIGLKGYYRFNVAVWIPSQLILEKKTVTIPVKVEFSDGRVYAYSYLFRPEEVK